MADAKRAGFHGIFILGRLNKSHLENIGCKLRSGEMQVLRNTSRQVSSYKDPANSMNPIKINLVLLGNLKYPIDVASLEAWKSKIVKIQHGASVGHLPDAEGDDWEYTDEQLSNLLSGDSNSDFTLGVINTPLEGNYYLRRLSDRVAGRSQI